MVSQTPTEYGLRPNTLTIPELEQSKAAVLNIRSPPFTLVAATLSPLTGS
jgi:hypothetical protein